jgi:cytochrome c biogenesis protein CcdA
VAALAFLVASIAFADSLNPSTVLPALYLSTGRHPARQITSFALGVFAVSFAAGVLIVAGPGQLILGVLPHVDRPAKHIVEIGVGVALLLVAVGFMHSGQAITKRIPSGSSGRASSTFVLGAGIMVVELPTALPYFAALAAIIGSGSSFGAQIGYVVLFNVVFVLPVLAVLALRMLAGRRAEERIGALGDWIRRYAHNVVAVLAGAAGVGFVAVGVAGLV